MGITYTEEQWQAVDGMVREVIREPPVFQMLPKQGTTEGKHEYKFGAARKFLYYNIGDDFSYDYSNRPAVSGVTAKLSYLDVPVFIKKTEIDASLSAGNSIESIAATAEIEMQSFFDEKVEEIIFHGCTGNKAVGMANYPGIQEYGADGNKALTTYGNFRVQLEGAIAQIRAEHIKPPYTLIVSPGIVSELRSNYASGVFNEWKEFKNTYMPEIIDRVIETDAICTDSSGNPTGCLTDTQTFLVAKIGQQYGYVVESYPPHRSDHSLKLYESDVAYSKLWAGGYIWKNEYAVARVTGLTSTTAY